MSDMLEDGVTWLSGQMKSYLNKTVTYSRGYDSVDVDATVGRTEYAMETDQGPRLEQTDKDFIIPVSGLDFGDGPIVPERGDIVYLTIRGETEAFEALPIAGGPVWDWWDPFKTRYRIHTKRVAAGGFPA